MQKKICFLVLLVFSFLFLPNIVSADEDACSSFGETDCGLKTYCEWDGNSCKISSNVPACNTFTTQYSCNNEGAGYCEWSTKKQECQSYIPNRSIVCNYEVETFNQSVQGNKVFCDIIISVSSKKEMKIEWYNQHTKESGELNENQDHFVCSGKGINFWNSQLPDATSKLEQITEIDGKMYVIYDFKQMFNRLTGDNRVCPAISFSSAAGNYYVIFDDSVGPGEFIYNTGGVQSGDDPDTTNPGENENNGEETPVDDPCNIVSADIISYVLDALRLIRWVGVVAVIIFGVLDFIKATAADDQDALKKAWQNFTKRLIAVIILFMIPLFVEFILYIARLPQGCDWPSL